MEGAVQHAVPGLPNKNRFIFGLHAKHKNAGKEKQTPEKRNTKYDARQRSLDIYTIKHRRRIMVPVFFSLQ